MIPETPDSVEQDGQQRLVAALLARIDELVQRVDSLVAQNTALLAQNEALLARIAELEAAAGKPPKTPQNSSLPPSSGQKANVADALTRKKRRKGRPGIARALCPNPDVRRDIYAERCACGAQLASDGQQLAHAYDHIDLPPIRPVTTRINLHRGRCPCCRARVAATPPADMPPGSPFGPGIVAVVSYLHACQMISYSRLTEVLDGLLGLKLSEGAIANMLARAAAPLATASAVIAATVRESPVIASDETSARVTGKTFWQWTFAAASAVAHVIAPSRGKKVPVEFLAGERPQVWISDRLAAQGGHAAAHQFCLAHLIREAQFAIDAGDAVFAPAFKALLQRACAIARRRNDLADSTLARYARGLERDLERLLATRPSNREGSHLRAAMSLDRDKLLVFMTRRDVEPTNNVSERALRPSVIFRRVTNGFRSHWGSHVYADICSIVATGRRNGRTPLAAIQQALAGAPYLAPA